MLLLLAPPIPPIHGGTLEHEEKDISGNGVVGERAPVEALRQDPRLTHAESDKVVKIIAYPHVDGRVVGD